MIAQCFQLLLERRGLDNEFETRSEMGIREGITRIWLFSGKSNFNWFGSEFIFNPDSVLSYLRLFTPNQTSRRGSSPILIIPTFFPSKDWVHRSQPLPCHYSDHWLSDPYPLPEQQTHRYAPLRKSHTHNQKHCDSNPCPSLPKQAQQTNTPHTVAFGPCFQLRRQRPKVER